MKRKQYILLAATILVLLVSLSFAQSQGPSPGPTILSQEQQKRTKGIEQHSENYQYTSGSPVIQIDRNVDTKKTDAGPKNSGKNEDQNTAINRRIMWATWIIAGAAIVQLIAAFLQFCAMRKTVQVTKIAAEAARKSAEALPKIERAYVFVNLDGKVKVFSGQST